MARFDKAAATWSIELSWRTWVTVLIMAANAWVSSTLDRPMAYHSGMGGVPCVHVRPPSSEYRNHAAAFKRTS